MNVQSIVSARTGKNIIGAALCALLSVQGAQANPCRSQWQSVSETFKSLAPLAAGLTCDLATQGASAGGIDKCIADYEEAKADVEDWIETYNSVNAGSGHVGPRACAPGYVYTGNVKAERLWICSPVVGKKWQLDLEFTGGKAKQDLTVDVCLIDPANGQAQRYFTETFSSAANSVGKTFYKENYGKSTALIPMVYLHKQIGTRGYDYTIAFDESGEPDFLTANKKLTPGSAQFDSEVIDRTVSTADYQTRLPGSR